MLKILIVLAAPSLVLISKDYMPLYAALATSIVPLLAIVLAYRRSGKKLQEIHILVNSRLDEALTEIVSLKKMLDRKDAVIATQEAAALTAKHALTKSLPKEGHP